MRTSCLQILDPRTWLSTEISDPKTWHAHPRLQTWQVPPREKFNYKFENKTSIERVSSDHKLLLFITGSLLSFLSETVISSLKSATVDRALKTTQSDQACAIK